MSGSIVFMHVSAEMPIDTAFETKTQYLSGFQRLKKKLKKN